MGRFLKRLTGKDRLEEIERKQKDELEEKERKLEAEGNIHALQYFRFEQRGRQIIPELLRRERRLREIAQRELVLVEEMSEVSRPTEKAEKELQQLRESAFLEACEVDQLYENIEIGPLKRGIELWRSHPQWYLHSTLTKDCASRGGCCGRSCGCCKARKHETTRKFSVGHCTIECGCCMESRGCELTEKCKEKIAKLFALDPYENTAYYRKIMMASVYGLANGSTQNPFDMIESDQPPKYQER